MISFWEKESFISYDVIIIGGGITGLSSAISVKELNPKLSVAIFEAGIFPSGASTKNAGFACFGSLSELKSDEKFLGTDKMLSLVENRWKGLELLRKRLGDKRIEFKNYGGYELVFNANFKDQEIQIMNEKLKPIFGQEVYFNVPNLINKFEFNQEIVKKLIFTPLEGQIHTGSMMKALIEKATSLGIVLFTNSKVETITSDGVTVNNIEFKSAQTIVCVNAFTKSLIPDIEIVPGRGQVCITKPIKQLKLKGTFHYDEGYYYFRNVGNRILIGGGRNLDFKKEQTTKIELNNKIQSDLVNQLKTIIPSKDEYEIDHSWAGIMGFGKDKFPIVKRIDNRTVIAVKLGGIGIALGSIVGHTAAEITLN